MKILSLITMMALVGCASMDAGNMAQAFSAGFNRQQRPQTVNCTSIQTGYLTTTQCR